MAKVNYSVTGAIKKTGEFSRVDFIAEGKYEINDGVFIPCEVGYYALSKGLYPAFIYIQNGITDDGTHYDKQTIEL